MRHAVAAGGGLEMHVRPARLEDIAALLALRAAALRAIRGPYSQAQIARWLDATAEGELGDAIDEVDDAVICASIDDGEDAGPVGFARLEYDTSVHLVGLYVDPVWQRRGIGAALIGAAHARCLARQVARIFVAASLNAVPFYTRHGYAGVERIDWRPSGDSDDPAIPVLRMVKDLR